MLLSAMTGSVKFLFQILRFHACFSCSSCSRHVCSRQLNSANADPQFIDHLDFYTYYLVIPPYLRWYFSRRARRRVLKTEESRSLWKATMERVAAKGVRDRHSVWLSKYFNLKKRKWSLGIGIDLGPPDSDSISLSNVMGIWEFFRIEAEKRWQFHIGNRVEDWYPDFFDSRSIIYR